MIKKWVKWACLTILYLLLILGSGLLIRKELRNPAEYIETEHLITLPKEIETVKDFSYKRIDNYSYRYLLKGDKNVLVFTNRRKENPWERPKDCYYGLFIEKIREKRRRYYSRVY